MQTKTETEIVSFFFLPTNAHRVNYQDILTTYCKEVERESLKPGSLVKARLFDGLGSDPYEKASDHPTPGRYIYNAEKDIKVLCEHGHLPMGWQDWLQQISGLLSGDGEETLLDEAVQYLRQVIKNNYFINSLITSINQYKRDETQQSLEKIGNLISMFSREKEGVHLNELVTFMSAMSLADKAILFKSLNTVPKKELESVAIYCLSATSKEVGKENKSSPTC